MLLVASGGCWWQAEVVGGKRRLLVASGGCWWQAEVVGGKQRLLATSRGCWRRAETVVSKMRLLAAASHSGVHRFQNQIYHKTLAFPGLKKGLPPVYGLFKGQLDPSSYSAPKFMALVRLLRKNSTTDESILAAIWHNNIKSNIVF